MRERRWYTILFGVQPPFPWIPVAVLSLLGVTTGVGIVGVCLYQGWHPDCR